MADKDTDKALLQPDEVVEKNVSDSNDEETSQDPSDKLTPDHPRFKQVYQDMKDAKADGEAKAKELEAIKNEMAELRQQVQERKDATGIDTLTFEEQEAINKIDRELKKKGYLTKSEADERDRVVKRGFEFDKLSAKYSGQGGYPKFNSEEVLAHAKRQGFGENYESAYFDLHREAIIKAEAKKASGQVEPPTSEKPAPAEQKIAETGLTPEQVAQMSPEEWEQKRSQILQGVKESIK